MGFTYKRFFRWVYDHDNPLTNQPASNPAVRWYCCQGLIITKRSPCCPSEVASGLKVWILRELNINSFILLTLSKWTLESWCHQCEKMLSPRKKMHRNCYRGGTLRVWIIQGCTNLYRKSYVDCDCKNYHNLRICNIYLVMCCFRPELSIFSICCIVVETRYPCFNGPS